MRFVRGNARSRIWRRWKKKKPRKRITAFRIQEKHQREEEDEEEEKVVVVVAAASGQRKGCWTC